MANVLPFETQVRAIGALVEGCSIRAVERMTGAHRDTIMRLGVRIGNACESLHNARMVGVQCSTLELDEAWSFIAKKRKNVTAEDPAEYGDCYLWIGLDANRKAIVSFRVGKRSTFDARIFLADLRARVLNRPQITSDGYAPYIEAVWESFGTDCDFAQLIKLFQSTPGNEAAVRYSPGSIRGIEKRVVQGNPTKSKISTSYVERQNLTLRMHLRRMTRLTNGFSKKLANHKAAISLHVAWYNFCRIHETLSVTPAMEIGIADHVWSIAELIEEATGTPKTPSPAPTRVPPTPKHSKHAGLPSDLRPRRFQVIKGGKI